MVFKYSQVVLLDSRRVGEVRLEGEGLLEGAPGGRDVADLVEVEKRFCSLDSGFDVLSGRED